MKRFIIIVGLASILIGCTKTVYVDEQGNQIDKPDTLNQIEYLAGTNNRFEIVNEIDKYLDEIRDVTTGVHYYFYKVNSGAGYSGFTPLYESDGSVRVTN